MSHVKRIEFLEVSGKHRKLINSFLVLLAWMSPFIGYEVFFPIALLFLYRINHTVRSIAFQAVFIQIFIWILCYPLELICQWDMSSPYCISAFKDERSIYFFGFWAFFGLFILFWEARHSLNKFGKLNKYREDSLPNQSSLYNLYQVLLSWFSAIFLYVFFNIFFGIFYLVMNGVDIFESVGQQEFSMFLSRYFKGEVELYIWFLNIHAVSRNLGRKSVLAILRKPYLSLYVHNRIVIPSKDLSSKSFADKSRFAKFREAFLPGWGIIYLNRYWTGFSVLFSFLLLFFFTVISWFYYIDYSFGTSFLQSMGLKPGIPDKEFIRYTSNLFIPVLLTTLLLGTYLFSNNLLRTLLERETDPIFNRGLTTGFKTNLSYSILIHLILISLLFVIPIMVTRTDPSKKKNDLSKQHFQPEKMEFYFIDPEIPDKVKDLNGGVISGTETTSQENGEKIKDEVSDNGKPKGFVKRIKGKPLTKTYSNYISARMRGPEMFMEYWKRAPHPYSCVVAYTITTEGEIIDIVIVESSSYPEQDQLTIELIESMSPLMPPPEAKGDVRVTELFWNGSLDPDAMPTPLQKDMVTLFDGRYLEEEP
jgi:hypothetical protein